MITTPRESGILSLVAEQVTPRGAKTFANLRSVVSTARKRGFNILQILVEPSSRVSNSG